MEVPLLYYEPSGEQIFRVDILRHIFQKVGPRPFVVLSFNGGRKTGKSYLLRRLQDQFLEMQEQRQREGAERAAVEEWSRESEIVNRVGMEVWSEPLSLEQRDGQSIALILILTHASFDSPSTVHQNSTAFALSAILSSCFVLNMRKSVSKDTLEFLQYYLNLAKTMGGKGNSGARAPFQRILFLVRDMELRVKDFAHGYHTPTSKPQTTAHSQTNLFTQIFNLDPTRQPLEVQHTYRQVLASFKDFGLFAFPEPRTTNRHAPQAGSQRTDVDMEFLNYMQAFLDLLISPLHGVIFTETKRVGGIEVTGYDYLIVIEQLERSLHQRATQSLARVGMHQCKAEMQNIISKSILLSLYVSTIWDFMQDESRKTGRPGMYQKTLAEKMNSFLKICLDTFSRRLSQGDQDLRETLREALSHEIQAKMQLFESLNESRIKYARQEQSLNSEANDLREQVARLRQQVQQGREREENQCGGIDTDMERSLDEAHNIHLHKRMEECQGKLGRLQEEISLTRRLNDQNLVQILTVIQGTSEYHQQASF